MAALASTRTVNTKNEPVEVGQPHVNGVSRDEVVFDFPSRSMKMLSRLSHALGNGNNSVQQAQVPLNILIVGAGLGGLATSVALARRGHRVTILEQAPALGQVGAGIQIPPNSARLLLSWGIGPFFKNRVVQPDDMTFRRWSDGKPIGYTKLGHEFEERFGAPYYVVYRADFGSALAELASSLGVVIVTNCKVSEYDDKGPTVRSEDGRSFGADLIVACDGIKSIARRFILGKDIPPKMTGFAAYRAVVDTALMKADPDTAWLLDKPGINIWIGEKRHVMAYSIAGGEKFNMVLSHVDHSDPSTWKQENAVAEMRDHFIDWDPRLLKLIHMINFCLKWPLMSANTLPNWISKNQSVILMGDAAHAMVPYMSQGAAMAVEDGAALAEALSIPTSTAEISWALSLFEKERKIRSYGMQSASLMNGKLWHYPDGPDQQARDQGMRAEVEGRHFLESTNQWSDPVTQHWAFGYDAEEAIRDARKSEKL